MQLYFDIVDALQRRHGGKIMIDKHMYINNTNICVSVCVDLTDMDLSFLAKYIVDTN